MKITRIYADRDGITHFEKIDIPLKASGPIGWLSEMMPGAGVVFRETSDDYDFDWHSAPRNQWVLLLDGEIQIEVGDGEIRRFGGGDVLRIEDFGSKGHRSRQLSKGIRRSVFIPFNN